MKLNEKILYYRKAAKLSQEELAEKVGVSRQAVSKWELGESLPDIGLLPALSACFGVTIDALFSLTDETRMERIQNMLWDERVLDSAAVEADRAFLLEKARREPDNGRPHELLADMENHLADEHRSLAAEYAKEALRREPQRRDAHDELVPAMGGRLPDWGYANHHALIRWYKEFLDKNPDCRIGYLWLLDQLIDDRRLEEARDYLSRMERVDGTFRTPLYRGNIAWADGDREGAMAIWEQMCADFPDDCGVWLSMGDVMARAGRYEDAAAHYRKAFALQPEPKFVDSLESIAQVCELAGDIPGAVAALEEEVAVLAQQWDTRTGETVDKVRRELQRLKAM